MNNRIKFASIPTLDGQIDHILQNGFINNDQLNFGVDVFVMLNMGMEIDRHKNILRNCLRYMADEGVISQNGPDNYSLTIKGYRIREKGGWIKYLEEKEYDRGLTKLVSESAIESNKISRNSVEELVQSNRNQKTILIATIIIAFINLVVAIIGYNKPTELFLIEKQMLLTEPLSKEYTRKLAPLQIQKCVHGNDISCCRTLGK